MDAFIPLRVLKDRYPAFTQAEIQLILERLKSAPPKTVAWGNRDDGSYREELRYPESVEPLLDRAVNFRTQFVQSVIGREYGKPRI
jgi:hypothetical protein